MKRLKEDDYIGGIKKETYDLLFKDENLPKLNEEEAQKSKENDKILDEISLFTTLDDKKIKDKILMKYIKIRFGIDFDKISYNERDKKYKYSLKDTAIPFEKLSDKIENPTIKRELMSKERKKKCNLRAITLIDIFRKSSFHFNRDIYKTWKKILTFCN